LIIVFCFSVAERDVLPLEHVLPKDRALGPLRLAFFPFSLPLEAASLYQPAGENMPNGAVCITRRENARERERRGEGERGGELTRGGSADGRLDGKVQREEG